MFIKLTQLDIDDPPIILNTNHIVCVRLQGADTCIVTTNGIYMVRDNFEDLDRFLVVYDSNGNINNTECEMLKLVKHIATGTVP